MDRRLRLSGILLVAIITLMTGCSAKKDQQETGIKGGPDAVQASSDLEGNSINTVGSTPTASAEKRESHPVAGSFGASTVTVDTGFSARDHETEYDDSTATHITLEGMDIKIKGEGAKASDGILTIQTEGTYVITGALTEGRLIVDAGDEDKIHIVLQGVSIDCSDNAPIYIKKADKVFLTLSKNTENTLTDGKEYKLADGDKMDGVIFSRADLTLNGEGSLRITGNYKHGVVSKDDLVFTGGNYQITAIKDAINGKDCVKIWDGNFLLHSMTGKGIESKNDEDNTKGYVYICGGSIKVTGCKEGIDSRVIAIAGGVLDITTVEEIAGSTDSANE